MNLFKNDYYWFSSQGNLRGENDTLVAWYDRDRDIRKKAEEEWHTGWPYGVRKTYGLLSMGR